MLWMIKEGISIPVRTAISKSDYCRRIGCIVMYIPIFFYKLRLVTVSCVSLWHYTCIYDIWINRKIRRHRYSCRSWRSCCCRRWSFCSSRGWFLGRFRRTCWCYRRCSCRIFCRLHCRCYCRLSCRSHRRFFGRCRFLCRSRFFCGGRSICWGYRWNNGYVVAVQNKLSVRHYHICF